MVHWYLVTFMSTQLLQLPVLLPGSGNVTLTLYCRIFCFGADISDYIVAPFVLFGAVCFYVTVFILYCL